MLIIFHLTWFDFSLLLRFFYCLFLQVFVFLLLLLLLSFFLISILSHMYASLFCDEKKRSAAIFSILTILFCFALPCLGLAYQCPISILLAYVSWCAGAQMNWPQRNIIALHFDSTWNACSMHKPCNFYSHLCAA